jgi:hypothetical protein
VRRVKRLQHLGVVEDFPQGVRARGFQEDLSLGKVQEGVSLRISRRINAGKRLLKACRSVAGWREGEQVFVKEALDSFRRNTQEFEAQEE